MALISIHNKTVRISTRRQTLMAVSRNMGTDTAAVAR